MCWNPLRSVCAGLFQTPVVVKRAGTTQTDAVKLLAPGDRINQTSSICAFSSQLTCARALTFAGIRSNLVGAEERFSSILYLSIFPI